MKAITNLITTIFFTFLIVGTLVLAQYTGWYGPEWFKYTGPYGEETTSPVIWAAWVFLLLVEIVCFITSLIIINEEKR